MEWEHRRIRSGGDPGESRDQFDPPLRRVAVRRKRGRRRVSWELGGGAWKGNGRDLGPGASDSGITYAAIAMILLFVAFGVGPLMTMVASPTSYSNDPVERAKKRNINGTRPLRSAAPRPQPYSHNRNHYPGLGLRL